MLFMSAPISELPPNIYTTMSTEYHEFTNKRSINLTGGFLHAVWRIYSFVKNATYMAVKVYRLQGDDNSQVSCKKLEITSGYLY